MLIVNNKVVPLSEIRSYEGKNEVMVNLKKKLLEIDEWDYPVKYRFSKGIYKLNAKSGLKEGKRAIFVTLIGQMNSTEDGEGTSTVRYAETINELDGMKKEYKPLGRWFRKNGWTLSKSEKDFILFVELFSPIVNTMNSAIVRMDLKGEADKEAANQEKQATLMFYLYNKLSPLYDNEEKLKMIAMGFGVANVNMLTVNQIKNDLKSVILKAEANTESKMGITQFEAAVKDQFEHIDVLAMIRHAMDTKKLKVDSETLSWVLTDGDKFKRTLINVGQGDHFSKMTNLAKYLVGNENKLEMFANFVNWEFKKNTPKNEDVTSLDDEDKGISDDELKELYLKRFGANKMNSKALMPEYKTFQELTSDDRDFVEKYLNDVDFENLDYVDELLPLGKILCGITTRVSKDKLIPKIKEAIASL